MNVHFQDKFLFTTNVPVESKQHDAKMKLEDVVFLPGVTSQENVMLSDIHAYTVKYDVCIAFVIIAVCADLITACCMCLNDDIAFYVHFIMIAV